MIIAVTKGLGAKTKWEKAVRDAREARAEGDHETEHRKLIEADAEEWIMQSQLDSALKLTAEAYDFLPSDQGTIKNGPFVGMKIIWKARFYGDNGHFREVVGPNGPHYLHLEQNFTGDHRHLGKTMDDGEIAIRLRAFEMALDLGSPRVLASVLYHETVHQQRLVGTGWFGSAEELERDAYELELEQSDDVFGLSSTEKSLINKIYLDFKRQAAEVEDHPDQASSPFTAMEDEAFNEEGFRRLEKLRADMSEHQARLEAKVTGARNERIREAQQKAYEASWMLLRTISRFSCKDPQGFKQTYQGTTMPDLFLPQNLLLRKIGTDGDSLNGCEKEVIAFITGASGTVSLAQVADVAWRSKSIGDPLNTVGSFFRSIQELLKSANPPAGQDPSPPASPGSPDGRPDGRNSGRAPIEPGNSPALDQLRGIRGGRISF